MRRLFFHEESIHEVRRRYLEPPYIHTHTYTRTSRNQYVPHFFKVGGIMMLQLQLPILLQLQFTMMLHLQFSVLLQLQLLILLQLKLS